MIEQLPFLRRPVLWFAITWLLLVLICAILPNGILNVAYEVYLPVLLIIAVAIILISRHFDMGWVKTAVWAILYAVISLLVAIISSISLFGCSNDVSPGVGITQACVDGSASVRVILISIISVSSLTLYLLNRSAHKQGK
jgi:hypothetical protein